MPIRLFHCTTLDDVAKIPLEGFRDGDDGVVWFTRFLDEFGGQGNRPIEVLLDMTEEELAGFAEEWVAGKELNGVNEEYVEDDGEFIERTVWYKIPAVIVNGCSTLRIIEPSELRRLELDIQYGLE